MKNANFPNQIKNVLSFTLFSLILGSPIASPAETLSLQMSAQSREALSGKEQVKVSDVVVEGEKSLPADLKTRGQSSMGFARKNYALSLNDEVKHDAHLKVDGIKADKLILSAGAFDPLLIKNRIAHKLFLAVKVPALETGLTELLINDESQGLYMVTKSPDDVLLKDYGAQIVLRRRYNDIIEVKKAKHSVDEIEQVYYQEALQTLHKQARKLKGKALVKFLDSQLELDTYFRFLAVNYLIKNGDYSDEVFFGGYRVASGEIKFKPMPWDLDDSFTQRMHRDNIPFNFNVNREEVAAKQLVYNYESRLDRALVENKELLARYFVVAAKVVTEITPEKIDQIIDSVASDLSPYLVNEAVLQSGKLDAGKKVHTVSGVESDIQAKRNFLKQNLLQMRAELEQAQSEIDSRATHFNKIEEKLGSLMQKIFFFLSK